MKKKTTSEYVADAKKVHGSLYDYSKSEYINNKAKVEIVCSTHGSFFQIAVNHLSGDICPKCSYELRADMQKLTDFVVKASILHGNIYSYEKTQYLSKRKPVMVTCTLHGDFVIRPDHHLSGFGCPDCGSSSRGAEAVKRYLVDKKVHHIREHKFADCKSVRPLSFDFYLPTHNTVIEFDGIQHFQPVKRFGGEDAFNGIKLRDNIKDAYCATNGIKMIRIPYTQYASIDQVLDRYAFT